MREQSSARAVGALSRERRSHVAPPPASRPATSSATSSSGMATRRSRPSSRASSRPSKTSMGPPPENRRRVGRLGTCQEATGGSSPDLGKCPGGQEVGSGDLVEDQGGGREAGAVTDVEAVLERGQRPVEALG